MSSSPSSSSLWAPLFTLSVPPKLPLSRKYSRKEEKEDCPITVLSQTLEALIVQQEAQKETTSSSVSAPNTISALPLQNKSLWNHPICNHEEGEGQLLPEEQAVVDYFRSMFSFPSSSRTISTSRRHQCHDERAYALLATAIVCTTAATNDDTNDPTTASACRTLIQSCQEPSHVSCSMDIDYEERVQECWTLLYSGAASIHKPTTAPTVVELGMEQLMDTTCSPSLCGTFEFWKRNLAMDVFQRVYATIRRDCLHLVSVPHPVATMIIERLPHFSEIQQIQALNALDPLVQQIFAKDGTRQQQQQRVVEDTDHNNSDHTKHLPSSLCPPAVRRARIIARLVQTMTEGGDPDDSNNPTNEMDWIGPLKQVPYYIVCPMTRRIPHSCLPSHALQASICTGTTTTNIIPTGKQNSQLELFMVPLYQTTNHGIISHDETERTISRLPDITKDVVSRRRDAMRLLGHSCKCVRCEYESASAATRVGVANMEQSLPQHVLERMGHLAMQQGRFEQARSLYRCILANNNETKQQDVALHKNGDIWHAIAASYLGQGHFLKAQQIWREAHEQHCPNHEAISLQIQKYNAYHQWDNESNKSWCNNNQQDEKILMSRSTTIPNFLSLLEGQCFVTSPDSPLLSKEECQMVVQWAEQEATLRQGWTTSRHYAVPTTDLPIHEMTDTVLPWFRQLWKYRLGPLMERQFGTAIVGPGGSHLYVHDAFCVRYNSNEQRHLPLHRDESTHSFVLALNHENEYEGGGTYIADLGTSIRPSVGGVVSFRGDSLLHGGDPVVSGTRYIIAAFLYLDQASHDGSDPASNAFDRNNSPNEKSFPSSNDFDCKAPPSKKSKNFSFARTKNDKDDDNTTESNNTGSFSFGFQL